VSQRRKLLVGFGASALLHVPRLLAQQPRRIARIGILIAGGHAESQARIDGFLKGLRELGYIEGKTVHIERRFANGNVQSLPSLASELMMTSVDIIFAPDSVAVQAAKSVTSNTPIVFATVGAPVDSGFVFSLSRPGGNITGVSNINPELSAKRLEVLKEIHPHFFRLAVFDSGSASSPNPPGRRVQYLALERTAKTLRVEMFPIDISSRAEFPPKLVQLRTWNADAIYVMSTPLNTNNRKLLVDFAAQARLPASYPSRDYVEAGGLMSYGPSREALYARAAVYVDRILKGVRPGELPVELPTHFELVLNLKTAKQLRLSIAPSVLVRADRVVE